MDKTYVVKKLICVVAGKFMQIASTIDQFVDLEMMTAEDVIERLKALEKRICRYIEHEEQGERKLLLTNDEWTRS